METNSRSEIDQIGDDMPHDYKKSRYNKWSSLQLIIVALLCRFTVTNPRNKNSYDLELIIWFIIILVLMIGKLVSEWGFKVTVFFIKRNLLLRKRVLYFVCGLKERFQNCIWLGLILIAWQWISDTTVERVTPEKKVLPYVTRIGICLFVGSFIWLLKTLIIQVLVSNFYVNKYFDRIKESLFKQYVINKLSGALEQEQKSTPKKQENGIMIEQLHRMNQKNISAWNMNRIMNLICTTMLTTSDKSLITQIFLNRAIPDFDHVNLEDLKRFLGNDEALNTILFDVPSSEQAFKDWVVNVFRERRALTLSLEDIQSVLEKVHQMLNVIVGIIIILLCFVILEKTNFFIFLCSILVLASIVCGGIFKTTFKSLRFLFIMHPFDVGDPCEIDGVQMTVEKMGLLTTIFLRYDNLQIMYPNSVLSNVSVVNLRRIPGIANAIDFCIHKSTSTDKVAKMEEMIKSYVENKSDYWQPEVLIDALDLNWLKISLRVTERINCQDIGERWKRTLLVDEMMKVFKDLDIEYSMLQRKRKRALASNLTFS